MHIPGETSGLNGEKTVYWPDRGTTVDLYAYYPYKSTGAGSTLLKTELPGDQTSDQAYSDSDVKTAQWTGITQYTNGQVILPFIHAFSRIRVNLVAGTGFTTADPEGCTVQIEDMYKEVVIDICKQPGDEGYLNNQTGSQTIKMHAGKGAIIIPRTVTAGNVLFTILDKEGNKMAIGKAATDKNTFLSNNQYDITLTLKKAGINVSADITNWKVNNIDMDGEQWLN